MRKISTLILVLASTNIEAKPSEIQRQMMNEPASMLDIFIEKSVKELNEEILNKTIHFDNSKESGEYFVETDNKKAYRLDYYVDLQLDWDSGKWVIFNYKKEYKNVKPTIKNAYIICNKMLSELDYSALSPSNAQHRGFTTKSYTAGHPKNVEKMLDNTIHRSYFTLELRHKELYTIECERPAMHSGEPIEFKTTGRWK